MINEMPPFCMRILKQQLGTGLEKPTSSSLPSPPLSLIRPTRHPSSFNATSFLIYNETFLSIRPGTVTKV